MDNLICIINIGSLLIIISNLIITFLNDLIAFWIDLHWFPPFCTVVYRSRVHGYVAVTDCGLFWGKSRHQVTYDNGFWIDLHWFPPFCTVVYRSRVHGYVAVTDCGLFWGKSRHQVTYDNGTMIVRKFAIGGDINIDVPGDGLGAKLFMKILHYMNITVLPKIYSQ